MKTGLPSFRLPEQAVRAASASRIALLFDLPRFTVADARTELVPPRPKLAEPDFEVFRAAFVPADVLRPYDQVGDLVQFNKTDLLKFRNFGKKSLTELDDLLESLNLSFGTDISKYKLDKD